MSRTFNLQDNPQFPLALDQSFHERRRGRASPVAGAGTWAVSNMPAFAYAGIINSVAAAATSDFASGSFINVLTTAAAADSNTVVTASAFTRRDWNPWIRFRFGAGSAAQEASVRHWIGAWSGDPSAATTLAALSAACFGWDSTLDGTAVDTTAFWKCECGNASAKTTVTTTFPVKSSTIYTAEIRMDTANAQVEFWMASHGALTAAKTQSPLVKVATIATTIPVAATPLFAGITNTVLAAAPAAKRLYLGTMEYSQD